MTAINIPSKVSDLTDEAVSRTLATGASFSVNSSGKVQDIRLTYNVKMYGAKGDLRTATSGVSTTSGSANLVYSGLTSADAGKTIVIPGAGAAGATLITTLNSAGTGTAVMAVTAGASVSNARITIFTNDLTAIQAAITAADNAGGGIVWFPYGDYGVSGSGNLLTLTTGIGIQFVGEVPTISSYDNAPTLGGCRLFFVATDTSSVGLYLHGVASTLVSNLTFIGQPGLTVTTNAGYGNKINIGVYVDSFGAVGTEWLRFANVTFQRCTTGLKFGANQTDTNNADVNYEGFIGFAKCNVGIEIVNQQSLNHRFEHLQASDCPTVLTLDYGGDIEVAGICAIHGCGSASNLQTGSEYVFQIGTDQVFSGGYGACTVNLGHVRIESGGNGNAPTGRLLKNVGDYHIIMQLEEANGGVVDSSVNPMVYIKGGQVTLYDSRIFNKSTFAQLNNNGSYHARLSFIRTVFDGNISAASPFDITQWAVNNTGTGYVAIQNCVHGITGLPIADQGSWPRFGNDSVNTSQTLDIAGTYTVASTSGTQTAWSLTPSFNTGGTGGATAMKVNLTGTLSGSGSHFIQDWQLQGASKATMSTGGVLSAQGFIFSAALANSIGGAPLLSVICSVLTNNLIGLVVKAGASQSTNNIQEWRKSDNTVLAKIGPNGSFACQGITHATNPGGASDTANYTLTADDHTRYGNASGGTFTYTLPNAASVPGIEYVLKNLSSTAITVATTASQAIDGSTTYSLSTTNKYLRVESNGSGWMITGSN